ncbi:MULTISPECIES: DUF86 domain-containing protein [unclassified Roseofilum]|uniref:HepT-like ribonuclease domain-containing protein n=1 Tax=unclassified Roseofilum TaxID=2620099 RepID=UPI001B09A011|nr:MULTISPECIES: DUF86 domain-containing protein [unclassified Roseofilum]MBP0008784.1 DUF86 domain-containing protein [Roseofilum sp. Belize Diploria]MBP0041330.1 DUF86 domain-containing protein [Roseofilum sp. SBFL]
MPSREFSDRVQDILTEVIEIEQFVEGMIFTQFCEDRRTLKAILYGLAVIGEATANISPQVHTTYPQVPWIDIRGMRNVVIHEYFQLDLEIIWETIQTDFPLFKLTLEEILRDASA